MPFARSTYRNAAAIIAASSQTYAEFAAYRDKLFFVPEPGIARSLCSGDARSPEPGAKLELIFVGGLGSLQGLRSCFARGCSLFAKRFGSLYRGRRRPGAEPPRAACEIPWDREGCFLLWLGQPCGGPRRLRSADVMVFPSVRDFGAGVVFEALATGAVPVVADFGGPGDIVHPEVGYKVPLTNENDIVAQMEKILTELAHDRDRLEQLRRQGMAYARECLTWDAKAQAHYSESCDGYVRQGPKPDFLPPKMLAAGIGVLRSKAATPSASSPCVRATTEGGCE